jgi:hypothetical protein
MNMNEAKEWWDGLPIRMKWDFFYKYNPWYANAPANIGMNINDIEDDHILEIWEDVISGGVYGKTLEIMNVLPNDPMAYSQAAKKLIKLVRENIDFFIQGEK